MLSYHSGACNIIHYKNTLLKPVAERQENKMYQLEFIDHTVMVCLATDEHSITIITFTLPLPKFSHTGLFDSAF